MRYVIPNFAKGLVDSGAAAQLEQDYSQKCSELENFYIAPDNTLLRRPPLRSQDQLIFSKYVRDFNTANDRFLVLADVPPEELSQLPESLVQLLWLDSVLGHRPDLETTLTRNGATYTYSTTRTIDGTEYTVELRATLQRLITFDQESGEPINDESYILASFAHTVQDSSGLGLGAKRVQAAGASAQLPEQVSVNDLEEPPVVAIYKGYGSDAELLASATQMPYKRTGISKPVVKTPNTTDVRFTYFPTLADAPIGLTESMFTDAEAVATPIDHLDAHPDGGMTVLFGGFRYRWDQTLQCENGPTLFPDFNEVSHSDLNTFIADNSIDTVPNLPIKVLYVPTTTKKSSTQPFQYTLSTVANALAEGRGLVEDIEASGLVTSNPLETLIDEQKVRGFSFDIFKELFPVLSPVTSNLQHVLGYYRDADDEQGYAYPDIKYLVAGTDINGAGSILRLYKKNQEQRAAVVQSSAPRFAVRPYIDQDFQYTKNDKTVEAKEATGFVSETSDVNRFPNRNGFAAGGVGVTLAVYKNYRAFRPGASATNLEFDHTKAQQPDGIFYLFYDYDNEQVKAALDDITAVSGFSASGSHYQSVVMRKAQRAPWRPDSPDDSDFIGTLLRSIEFQLSANDDETAVVNSGENTFYNDIGQSPSITNQKAWLLWPFGPSAELIKNFGTPVFISSLGNTTNDYLALSDDIGADAAATGTYTAATANNARLTAGVAFKPSAVDLMRYIAYPTTYAPAIGDIHVLPGRTVVTNNNNAHFSAAGVLNKFSDHIKDYFSRVSNTPDSRKVLSDSGIPNVSLVASGVDPQSFTFHTPLGEADNILSIGGPEADAILIGAANSIKRIRPGTLDDYISFETVSSAGVTSPIIYDTTMFIGASDKDVLTARYFRQMQGYDVSLVNRETRTLVGADSAVSLIPKHRLVLFASKESNVITCISLGADRQFKGLSKFTLPRNVNVTRMKRLNADSIGFLLSDGSYATMNFNVDTDTDYTDSIEAGESTYNSVVTTLPMYTMDERRFSPGTSLAVRELFLCLHGYIEGQVSILDDITGAHATFDLRHTEHDDAAELKLFSGIYPQKSIPGNGSVAPRLRFEKNDNRYLAISSVVAEVK